MYIPAERNFLSYVQTPQELKLSSEALRSFLVEFDKAKHQIKGRMNLPLERAQLEYDRLNDMLNIKGKDYKLKLREASSGFQSLVPLHLLSNYLSKRVGNQE